MVFRDLRPGLCRINVGIGLAMSGEPVLDDADSLSGTMRVGGGTFDSGLEQGMCR